MLKRKRSISKLTEFLCEILCEICSLTYLQFSTYVLLCYDILGIICSFTLRIAFKYKISSQKCNQLYKCISFELQLVAYFAYLHKITFQSLYDISEKYLYTVRQFDGGANQFAFQKFISTGFNLHAFRNN